MKAAIWSALTVLMLLSSPGQAAAQCMGSGPAAPPDHAHGRSQEGGKSVKAIRKILDDERDRSFLLEAIFQDPDFVRLVIARIVDAPEWRALATEEIATRGARIGAASPDSAARRSAGSRPDTRVAQYVCPMHPDVVSSKPGECPRCGMDLVRRKPL